MFEVGELHFFHLFPPGPAASLRSDCFFAGALFFARMTLRRSAFRGFQIGFRRYKSMYIVSFLPKDACKSDGSRQELSNEYLVAKIGVSKAEDEPLKIRSIFDKTNHGI